MLDEEERRELLKQAAAARRNAYAPYSNFLVGAALLADDGSISTGCNVENASFGLTICAERNALFRAVAEGKRGFSAIAVVAGSESPATPCGACRQVLAEFARDMIVILGNPQGEETGQATLEELLPRRFGPEFHE